MVQPVYARVLLLCSLMIFTTLNAASPTMAETLGYAPGTRLLIIHADDVGLSDELNRATFNALENGGITSLGLMVPADGFQGVERLYSKMKNKPDVGVHFTLTSDWNNAGWKSVAPRDQVPTLLNQGGFFWPTPDLVFKNGNPSEVRKEITAQLQRAFNTGFEISHVDSHMGVLYFDPRFLTELIAVSTQFGVTPTLTRWSDVGETLDAEIMKPYISLVDAYSAKGGIVLDSLYTEIEGTTVEERRKSYYKLFKNLKPGLSELLVDLAYDSESFSTLTKDSPYKLHYQDHEIFSDPKTIALLREENIQLTSWKELRERSKNLRR